MSGSPGGCGDSSISPEDDVRSSADDGEEPDGSEDAWGSSKEERKDGEAMAEAAEEAATSQRRDDILEPGLQRLFFRPSAAKGGKVTKV